ncbi:MAG: AAA family ATPase, partial [bacterium]|nr:AAA family ATPase [bacterium]
MKNNSKIIAMVGKGGVGKTALSASLGRALIMKKQKPLLIDADPAQGLTYMMGLGPDQKTIGLARDAIIERAQARGKDAKEEIAAMFDYLVTEALIEKEGFSFLAMGRSQSKGCFCPLNNLLRQAIESLSRNFPYVLIDAEAGIEQINREVVRSVSHLIVLVDLSLRSIAVAEQIRETIKRLWIDCRLGVVANRS